MLVVHVHVRVVPDRVDDFLAATRANAEASVTEPGVLRFDVLTDQADPTHVVLVEVYSDEAGAKAHKDTPHYATWRDAVADLMAVPRESTRFDVVFPTESDRWAL
jgi:autoinducer 2-degrading protein